MDRSCRHAAFGHTGASTATISRVNRCLTYGAGGYQLILGKTKFGDETSEDNP